MAEEQIIVDRRRYSFAQTMETERRLKQEAAASWKSSDISFSFVFLLNAFALKNRMITVIFNAGFTDVSHCSMQMWTLRCFTPASIDFRWVELSWVKPRPWPLRSVQTAGAHWLCEGVILDACVYGQWTRVVCTELYFLSLSLSAFQWRPSVDVLQNNVCMWGRKFVGTFLA